MFSQFTACSMLTVSTNMGIQANGVSASMDLSVLFKDMVPLFLRLLRLKSRKNRSRILLVRWGWIVS